jgi:DNA replication protein DnaC
MIFKHHKLISSHDEYVKAKKRLEEINRPRIISLWLKYKNPNFAKKCLDSWDERNPAPRDEHFEIIEDIKSWENAREAEAEAKIQKQASYYSLEKCGVGQRALEALEEVSETDAVKAGMDFYSGGKEFWFLSGPPGTGKTVAASWVLRKASLDGDRITFRRAADMSRLSLYGDGMAEYRSLCELPGVLVIDDLGLEVVSDSWRQTLDGIVDARYANMYRLILTTNLTPIEFKKKYGERIADRFREIGKITVLSQDSIRKK